MSLEIDQEIEKESHHVTFNQDMGLNKNDQKVIVNCLSLVP